MLTQAHRLFFESLLATVTATLQDAFTPLRKRAEVERELGQLFRSRFFNVGDAQAHAPRSVDTLSVRWGQGHWGTLRAAGAWSCLCADQRTLA